MEDEQADAPVHVVMLEFGEVRCVPAKTAKALIDDGKARLATEQDIAIGT
jgi:hypothetical protein